MSRVLDLTGPIYTGMWSYGEPFPQVTVRPLPTVSWVRYPIYAEIFDGMNSQCGTYLETPAHLLGDRSYPLSAVSVERLFEMPAVVLKLELPEAGPCAPITRQALEAAPGVDRICPGDALLLCTGWGERWRAPDFVEHSPFITREAMDFLIGKKPFLLGSDFPRWDNLASPQGFWQDFYAADILMLAPLCNLTQAPTTGGRLTALPLRVEETCCAPCRAVMHF